MLDVHRAVDVDPGPEQLLDILPPLCVPRARARWCARARRPGASPGRAGERAVEIELARADTPVLEHAPWQDFEPIQQRLRFAPTVGFHNTYHDVHALTPAAPRLLQHGVCLPDAGGRAEEDLQAATDAPVPGRRCTWASSASGSGRSPRHPATAFRAPEGRRTDRGESSARLSSRTLTRVSPSTPNARPSVARVTSASTAAGSRPRVFGHPAHLVARGSRRDMRIEPAARSGHEVDGHRARLRIGGPEAWRSLHAPHRSAGLSRSQVRAPGAGARCTDSRRVAEGRLQK